MTLFGLILPKPGSSLAKWGYRLGILLTVAGSGLVIVSS